MAASLCATGCVIFIFYGLVKWQLTCVLLNTCMSLWFWLFLSNKLSPTFVSNRQNPISTFVCANSNKFWFNFSPLLTILENASIESSHWVQDSLKTYVRDSDKWWQMKDQKILIKCDLAPAWWWCRWRIHDLTQKRYLCQWTCLVVNRRQVVSELIA